MGFDDDLEARLRGVRPLGRDGTSPPKCGIASALSRARKRGRIASLTTEQWLRTLAFFDERCAYCRRGWALVEHVIDLDLGGGTTFDNCVPACTSCNGYKGKRTLAELVERVRRQWYSWEIRNHGAITLGNLERVRIWLERCAASEEPA